jgi:hypothetical protein
VPSPEHTTSDTDELHRCTRPPNQRDRGRVTSRAASGTSHSRSPCSSPRSGGSPSTPTRSSAGAASPGRSCSRSRRAGEWRTRHQDRIPCENWQWLIRPSRGVIRPSRAGLETQPERRKAARDLGVEGLLVRVGLIGLERAGVCVANLPERLAALFDELQVGRVPLLRLLRPCAVVRALCPCAGLEQVGVVFAEDRELPPDQVLEASHRSVVQ